MKLTLSLVLLTFALSAAASERSFRILPGSTTASGFALAWGIPGEKIDFEKIEAAGDDAVEKFINDNVDKLANFVVDTERDVILNTITGDGVYANLGGHPMGNYYYLSISEFNSSEVKGIEYEENVVVVNTHWKWSGGLTNAFVVRKDDRATTFVKELTLTPSLVDSVKAQLSADQKVILEKVGTDESIIVDSMMNTKIEITGEIPKCSENCVSVAIKSDLSMEVKDNNLVFNLTNLEFKSEDY